MSNFYSKYLLPAVAAAMVAAGVVCVPEAKAWEPEFYASQSRLAGPGLWVKVSVTDNGIHFIPTAKLREWGFEQWDRVQVYGTGGTRISDHLIQSNFDDDLLPVQSVTTADGLYFWANGPLSWVGPDENGWYHHRFNPFTVKGYYFLNAAQTTPENPVRDIPVEGLPLSEADEFATTVTAAVYHEVDAVSPGESGHLLVGEDFRTTQQQTFTFDLPGRVADTDVNSRVSFYTYVPASSPTLRLTVNGLQTDMTRLPRTTSSAYGDTTLLSTTFPLRGNSLQLGLSFSSSTTVLMANLNYIDVNYTRELDMLGKPSLEFFATEPALRLAGTTVSKTRVWDITDTRAIIAMDTRADGTALKWVSEYSGPRRYIAWNETPGAYPCPVFEAEVEAQNIHGEETPDYIIFTPAAWYSQAERVANIHRGAPDHMRVLVLDQQQVFNEFGSGMPDVGALRRCLKMFYDRGTDAEGHHLRYAMMMSRPLFDHRHLTNAMSNEPWELVPQWQTDSGNDDSYSFGMDDFAAMLEDGSGLNLGNDKICLAVGRMPVRSVAEAKTAVDKLINYVTKSPEGDWKNRMVLLADDQDNGIHLEQAEDAVKTMLASQDGERWLYRKVYLDAYEKISGVCEGARTDLYKWLNEGAAWWIYIGHASIDTWSGEGVMTRKDIKNNLYFSHCPLVYAATCSFARWDSSFISGMEMMWQISSGGIIGGICPTRPVYISSNGVFTRQWANALHLRDEDGRFQTAAETLRRAKNMGKNDTNRLRYVFMGDPAMHVPTPVNQVVLTAINGEKVDSQNAPTVAAHSQAVFEGYVADANGSLDPSFSGTLSLTLYDAEYSVTTLGRGDNTDPGKKCVFEQQGSKLYSGRTKVVDGKWSMTVAMPSEIAWNYRPAAVNLYAISDIDSNQEAMGFNRNLFVYGYDDDVEADTEAPVIHALYLNNEKFKNGDSVNEQPVLFAEVSDNVGINLSQAGVGHTIYVKLDNDAGYTDVNDFYTPRSDGTAAGSVKYPMPTLDAGHHQLTFRVWDTSNNFAEQELEFYVIPGLAPDIFDIWIDLSPASLEANFYISHNRPDAILEVTVSVYDLMGRPVWTSTQKGRSSDIVSAPLRWDLNDQGGNRVPRGIYVYRATVSTDGEHTSSKSKRMAVTAP